MTGTSSPWHSDPRPAFELTSPAPANSLLVGKGRQGKSTRGFATQSAITAKAGLKPQRRPKPDTPAKQP